MKWTHALALCLAGGVAVGVFQAFRTSHPPAAAKATLSDADLLFYEGIRRGYVMDDLIVRRELVRRVSDAITQEHPQAEPSDAELTEWLNQHADRYQAAPRYSFDQVYLSRGAHGAGMDRAATAVQAQLRDHPEAFAAIGDPFPHGHHFERLTPMQIEAIFGHDLAQGIPALAPGHWQGPLQSPLGVHFVRVTGVEPGRTLTLAEARPRLRIDDLLYKRQQTLRAALLQLRKDFSGAAPLPRPAIVEEDIP